jgi:radical SAM superfamily enzyme with C-terminal helix-hairpin-helix motif
MDVVVIDGYVDEPASLGVRPFLHPMVRAMYGAAMDAGAGAIYLTMDHIRNGMEIPRADVYAFHGGTAVPGRYLRSMPASDRELNSIVDRVEGQVMVGGPAALSDDRDDVILARMDAAAALHDLLLRGDFTDRWRTLDEWNRWLLLGSSMVRQHPDFPEPLIVEVETYRGCLRYHSGGCSFCVEPLKGKPVFRNVDDIVDEASNLRKLGVANFRLGGQTCFMSYMASCSRGEVVPNPEAVDSLLSGLASLKPRVLHLDNANPAVIAARPEESMHVLRSVVKHCTSGNVMALGMESADPSVIEANNLNATPDQVMSAIDIINDIGGERGENGLPRLLPGLNFIIGLDGESPETLELNMDFLKDVLKRGHLLRRINIRQVIGIRRDFKPGVKRSQFIRFKKRVREEVDRPSLERLVPIGTVLKDVYIERREGNRSFGRQVGSYPILVGFEYPLRIEGFVDAAVVGWGYRSITAVEHPLSLNSCPMSALTSLPGIGKKRAARLMRARPLRGKGDLILALEDERLAEELEDMLSFRPDGGEA